MKIVLVIMVYDRLENIKRWVECWKDCHQKAEMIVIQNYDGSDAIRDYCEGKVKYLRRENIGFDIGTFQDICLERLEGFNNDWDLLLWCADDTIPMRKDFIAPFYDKIKDATAVVCTDLSPHVKTHIRTTGFMIKKEVAKRLTFPVDPVVTKNDCYQFEHLSQNAFYEQIINMGLKVSVSDTPENSPLWDTGYKRKLDRGDEHFGVFKKRNKVTFICPIYNSYPQIISSLILQTHTDWELILVHDGPNSTGLKDQITDPRIKYFETETRQESWGHPIRKWGIENVDIITPDSDFIVITNADNYHVPTYTEYMIRGFIKNPESVAVYCSDMVHSYKAWQVIPCSLRLGYIDCAGVMVRKDIAKCVGWSDTKTPSSDWIYFNDIITKYGADKWTKVQGCLLIHN